MGVYQTYSKRKNLATKGGEPDVYRYDHLPDFLRKQIVMIWRDAIESFSKRTYGMPVPTANKWWDKIATIMTKEAEAFVHDRGNSFERCSGFLL